MARHLFYLLLLVGPCAFGQVIFSEIGQTISKFNYTNSTGGSLNNLQSGTGTYVGLGYKIPLKSDKTSIILGGLYSNYAAIGSDAITDNYFEWDVSYVGVNVGAEYKFARSREFVFFIKATASLEYLLRGVQTLNNQVFKLNGEDEFDNFIVAPRIGLGVQYPISNTAALYAQYQYGTSFSLINSNPEDSEKLRIDTHNIGIGIVIALPGCNCSL